MLSSTGDKETLERDGYHIIAIKKESALSFSASSQTLLVDLESHRSSIWQIIVTMLRTVLKLPKI